MIDKLLKETEMDYYKQRKFVKCLSHTRQFTPVY